MDKKKKAKLLIVLISLISGVLIALFASTFAYRNMEHLPMDGKYLSPVSVIASIVQNQTHRMMFGIFLLIIVLLIVFIAVSFKGSSQFASEMDRITDKISTPKRIGQLQHGSAQWLKKESYGKAFTKYELRNDNSIFSTLLEAGRKDILEIQRKGNEQNKANTESANEEKADTVKQEESSTHNATVPDTAPHADTPTKDVPVAIETPKQDNPPHKLEITETNPKVKGKVTEQKKKQRSTLSINRKAGLVVHYQRDKKGENIFCLGKDIHSLILGATGSSKTRALILQSCCLLGLSGESMVINDPKAEIYNYMKPFLERLEYEVIALDFRNPLKSSRYNFLQPVIDALNENDHAKAVDLVWDITASLVGETKGERIWNDGEASVIAGSMMSVAFDNQNNPQYQNCTNVYSFINNMSRQGEKGEMPLNKYVKSLPDDHPAKELYGVMQVAPSRTRGSFLTSALATLRLFTNPNIYNMTCDSDFKISETGDKKRAIFIILPDEKTTFYSLASLFIYQHYVALVENADKKGGRLSVRVNFMLDEFGQTKFPSFTNMLTVSRGRGMRFNLVLQSFAQIEDKYGREQTETVRDNCNCLVFLQSDNPNTVKEISTRLGNYTTSSFSRSASVSANRSSNNSDSMNLISRPLLTTEEVQKIERPYALVMYSGFDPLMANLPDISQWDFNTALGMGTEEHNRLLRLQREQERQKREPIKMDFWGIWNDPAFSVSNEKEQTATETAQPPKPTYADTHWDYPQHVFQQSEYGKEDESGKTLEEIQREKAEKAETEKSEKEWREENMY